MSDTYITCFWSQFNSQNDDAMNKTVYNALSKVDCQYFTCFFYYLSMISKLLINDLQINNHLMQRIVLFHSSRLPLPESKATAMYCKGPQRCLPNRYVQCHGTTTITSEIPHNKTPSTATFPRDSFAACCQGNLWRHSSPPLSPRACSFHRRHWRVMHQLRSIFSQYFHESWTKL